MPSERTLHPKFRLGETLAVRVEPGLTGKVILIDPYRCRYLLDCVGTFFDWYWLYDDQGQPRLFQASWYGEEHLYRSRRKRP